MFQNQATQRYNNNNQNGVNVNTKLYASYADDSLLTITGWNQNLSLKFHPVIGTNQDGTRQYANGQGNNSGVLNFILTIDNAIALIDGIEKSIIPALQDKKEASVSVISGDNQKLLTVSTKDGTTMVSYAGGLTDGKTEPNNVLTHTFNTREYYSDYDISTGSSTPVAVPADFENFVKKLHSINKISGEVSHAINYSNAIRKSVSDRFGSNNGGNSSNYQAPTTNFSGSDVTEFIPFS